MRRLDMNNINHARRFLQPLTLTDGESRRGRRSRPNTKREGTLLGERQTREGRVAIRRGLARTAMDTDFTAYTLAVQTRLWNRESSEGRHVHPSSWGDHSCGGSSMGGEGHVLFSFSDPEHLLVFAEIPIAAETLLDDLAGAHAQGATGLGLLVHTASDAGDVFGGGIVWEGGVYCLACAFGWVGVGCPFFEEGEEFDLCARHVEGVVGGDDCAVAGAVFWGGEDAEGGSYVGADYWRTCQGGFAESER